MASLMAGAGVPLGEYTQYTSDHYWPAALGYAGGPVRASCATAVALAPATAVAPPSAGGSAPRAPPPQCAHHGGSGAEAVAEEETAEWACARCTLLNPPLAPICAACDERRQVAPPPRAPFDGASSRGVGVPVPAGKTVAVGSKRPAATTPSTSSSKTPRAAVARMWKL